VTQFDPPDASGRYEFETSTTLAESYRKRALGIIYGDQIKGMSYFIILFLANLESLKGRRQNKKASIR